MAYKDSGNQGGNDKVGKIRQDIDAALNSSCVTLGDVMNKSVVTIEPGEPIVQAAKKMSDRHISCMVVTHGEEICGILTETDFIRKVIAQREDINALNADKIMSSPVISLDISTTLIEACGLMEEKSVKRLAVTEDGKLVGIVTQTDLIQATTSQIYCGISDIMSTDVAAIESNVTVAEAAEKLAAIKISCLAVTEKGKVVGMVTERDILKKVIAEHLDPASVCVDQVMASPVISVPVHYSAFSTGKMMESHGIRRMLVMDSDALCGIVTQTDIFRAARRMLEEQRKQNRIQSEGSNNGICDLDPEGKIIYANRAFLYLLGLNDADELKGQYFLPECFWINPAFAGPFLKQLNSSQVELKELNFKTRDGEPRHVTVFATYNKTIHGDLESIRVVIYDITAKKELAAQRQTEQSLRESEERFRNLMEHIPGVAIQGYTAAGEVFYWNKASQEMYGYSADEAVGQNVIDLVVPEELEQDFREILSEGMKVAKSGQFAPSGEMMMKRKDGQFVPVHSIHTAVSVEGKDTQMFRIDVDLSERKKVEMQLLEATSENEKAKIELEHANRKLKIAVEKANHTAHEAVVADLAKSRFLANMSHEIRTPLNAIMGLSDVLAEENLSSEQKNHLAIIRESAENMLVLINDILDFSKIEAGNFNLEVNECSLEHILAVVESIMRPKALQKNLDFSIIQKTDLPTTIKTDALRLRQCLVNLIGNAIDNTSDGHVHLLLSMQGSSGQASVKFEIEDTSRGFELNGDGDIFGQFVKHAADSNQETIGTGLGLTLTKKLIELLGGKVNMTSSAGNGTKFMLDVPAGVDVDSQPKYNKNDIISSARKDAAKAEHGQLAGRVLVAEDTPTNQTLIKLLLQKLGLESEIAEDGNQAVEKALNGDFDIILMDIQMPNMNGYDATRKLRDAGYEKPIIAVTAHAMKGDREKCIAAGCDDYVSKPIDKKKLIESMTKHLQTNKSGLAGQVENIAAQVDELGRMTAQDAGGYSTVAVDNESGTQAYDVIDYNAVMEICDDEDVITEVVNMFLNDSPRCVKSIAEAIKSSNPKHIRMYAHSLKGASSQIGAKRLADLAYQLECAGRDKKMVDIPLLFSSVQDEYSKLTLFLRQPNWMELAKSCAAV